MNWPNCLRNVYLPTIGHCFEARIYLTDLPVSRVYTPQFQGTAEPLGGRRHFEVVRYGSKTGGKVDTRQNSVEAARGYIPSLLQDELDQMQQSKCTLSVVVLIKFTLNLAGCSASSQAGSLASTHQRELDRNRITVQ